MEISPTTQARIDEIAGRGYESIERYDDKPKSRRIESDVSRFQSLDSPYRKPRRTEYGNSRDVASRIMPEGKTSCSVRKSGGIHS